MENNSPNSLKSMPLLAPDSAKAGKRKDGDDDGMYDAAGPDDIACRMGGSFPHPLGDMALPPVANFPNYDSMNLSSGADRADYKVSAITRELNARCGTAPGGRCLHNVADALAAGGFDLRREILQSRGNVGHDLWANEAIPVLQRDTSRFNEITSAGNDINLLTGDKIKVGSIAVWDGNKGASNDSRCGHIQVCSGFRPDGSPIWKSDYTAREGSTGLLHPELMGQVHVFVPKGEVASDPKVAVNNQTSSTPAAKVSAPVFHA